MDQGAILDQVGEIIRRTFRAPGAQVTRETTALDIDGWDSLSHTSLMMEVEAAFGIELPTERMFDLADVGELVDLIGEARGGG